MAVDLYRYNRKKLAAAVRSLSFKHLNELAAGPIEDPDECRICETFDAWYFGFSPDATWATDEGGDSYIEEDGPFDDPIYFVIDYHQDENGNGEGPEVYARCLEVYELATNTLIGGLPCLS
jgi:hypothetical protein